MYMNRRQLWNSHQGHKFLRAEVSRDILKFRVLEMASLGIFKMYFPPWMPCCFVRILARLAGNSAVELSHDIARSKHFTDLNLFKYAFSVIPN